MTEKELLQEAYARTVYAGLKVVSLSLNLLKQESRFKDRQKVGVIEKTIDSMLDKIKLTFVVKNDREGYKKSEEQFDAITDFTFELQAIAAIIPTDKELYDRILEKFGQMCQEEITQFTPKSDKQ